MENSEEKLYTYNYLFYLKGYESKEEKFHYVCEISPETLKKTYEILRDEGYRTNNSGSLFEDNDFLLLGSYIKIFGPQIQIKSEYTSSSPSTRSLLRKLCLPFNGEKFNKN